MFAIKKILVPTDFSAASELALRYGRELAKILHATLNVFHVADDPVLFANTTSDEYRSEAIDESNRQLNKMLSASLGDLQDVTFSSKCGSAATAIVDYAKEAHIDLIVMGSHGRSAIASMLLGNVAEHVVRHSTCPVMTVRSPQHEFEDH